MEKIALEEDRGAPEAFVFCEHGQSEKLHILFVGGIISSAMLVLENQEVRYIAMLDSTGIARGYAQDMAASVIGDAGGLVVCFSHPKDELIFRKTKLKRIMEPRELFGFWKHVFESRCRGCSHGACYLQCWSSFEPKCGFPYKSVGEIKHFPDDPKTRLIRGFRGCAITVHDLFDGLLASADFVRGGLIFSFCGIKEPLRQDSKDMCPDGEQGAVKPSFSRVALMIRTLRRMDFSSHDAARSSSEVFASRFQISSAHLRPMWHSIPRRKIEACLRVVPRKL